MANTLPPPSYASTPRADSFAVTLFRDAFSIGRRAVAFAERGDASTARILATRAASAANFAVSLTADRS